MKRMATSLLPMLGLFVLLMISLYLMSDVTQSSTRFGQLYISLLVLNTLLLIALIALIGTNLYGLVRQVIAQEPGSRLTFRLMLMFVVLALVPVAIVYTFSVKFLDRGIDSWFDVRVEEALEGSLDLSRSSLDLLMRQLRRQTEPMAVQLADVPAPMAPLVLNDLLIASGAIELTLFDHSRIIASSGELSASMVPRMPGEDILRLVSLGQSYVGLEPGSDVGLQVRLVLPVPGTQPDLQKRMLQVLYPLTGRINDLAGTVQDAYGKYNELSYLRKPLKQSFTLTLSLVLLLSVLFAVWAAFFSSRRLMAPVHELAQGTKLVAAGEFHKKLPVGKRDDLGMLVESFNQMTARLAQARDAAETSQRLVEEQRTYLQTVLENLSSGIMTLDNQLVLRTVNATGSQILGIDLPQHLGCALSKLAVSEPVLEPFFLGLIPVIESAEKDWQREISLLGTSGRKVLMCRGTRLPNLGGSLGEHVIVFDDVTELIRAQRDAAWGEVARRLAHEIKNPLTPIQLSAERLRAKLLPQLQDKEARVLDRSTHTIVQQVESMKTMVNAFSEYARPPTMETSPLDLNDLVAEVTELYRSNPDKTKFVLKLERKGPRVDADAVRIRQLLHNLIKNSCEALQGQKGGQLRITTGSTEHAGNWFVELVISDNGPGIPEEIMEHLFEPYITNKVRGNGLGLAIVKKIVEEHSGMVWAENGKDGGAKIRIMLPVAAADQAQQKLRGNAA
ncbi:MAG: ATP-binding protein [Gammaproteobacteria bacterium]